MKHALIALALVASTAHAEFWDGNKLHQMMTGTQSQANIALGYIAGAADAGITVHHCPPDNVTLGQIEDVVRNWLVEFPQLRNQYSADVIVTAAIKRYWPCQNQQRREIY